MIYPSAKRPDGSAELTWENTATCLTISSNRPALEKWYIDPIVRPQDRRLAPFNTWCEVDDLCLANY